MSSEAVVEVSHSPAVGQRLADSCFTSGFGLSVPTSAALPLPTTAPLTPCPINLTYHREGIVLSFALRWMSG